MGAVVQVGAFKIRNLETRYRSSIHGKAGPISSRRYLSAAGGGDQIFVV